MPWSQARSPQTRETAVSGVCKPPGPCASLQQPEQTETSSSLEFQTVGSHAPCSGFPLLLAWAILPGGNAGGTVTSPERGHLDAEFPLGQDVGDPGPSRLPEPNRETRSLRQSTEITEIRCHKLPKAKSAFNTFLGPF